MDPHTLSEKEILKFSLKINLYVQQCEDLINAQGLELKKLFADLKVIAKKFQDGNKASLGVNVFSSVSGIVGGTLTIVGLALAPVTAGVSTALSIAGLSVGGTGGAIQITKEVSKSLVWKRYGEAAQHIIGKINKIFQELYETLDAGSKPANKLCDYILSSVVPSDGDIKVTLKNLLSDSTLMRKMINLRKLPALIKAAKALKASPDLASQAAVASAVGKVSEEAVESLGKAAPVAMSKAVRVGAIVFASIFVAWDLKELVENSIAIDRGSQCAVANELYDIVERMEKALIGIEARLDILRKISDLLA